MEQWGVLSPVIMIPTTFVLQLANYNDKIINNIMLQVTMQGFALHLHFYVLYIPLVDE